VASDDHGRSGGSAAYSASFYDDIDQMSRDSAAAIVPWLVDTLGPASVVDVGCGRGAWLAAFRDAGVDDVLGLDGDYVERHSLHIDASQFRAVDLVAPPDLGRRFDLAVSLEVAEHLPADDADGFVRLLTSLAPVVIFSGAIPGQGGTHHVNEQWPAYWAQRFEREGYRAIDAVRPRFWEDPRVAYYFAQNVVVYAEATVASEAASDLGSSVADDELLGLVHPGLLAAARDPRQRSPAPPPSVRSLVRAFPGAVRRSIEHRRRRVTS
jgi:SAM-dependent methyltransferase